MRFVLPNHVLAAGMAILEPMAQNRLAGDVSQAEPLREPAVPPRSQLLDQADLEDTFTDATPTLTAGTHDGLPRTPEQANRAQCMVAEHPFLRRYDHRTDPSASVPYRQVFARVARRLRLLSVMGFPRPPSSAGGVHGCRLTTRHGQGSCRTRRARPCPRRVRTFPRVEAY